MGRRLTPLTVTGNRNQRGVAFLGLNYWHWCQDAVNSVSGKKTFCLQLSGQSHPTCCIDKVILSRKPVQGPLTLCRLGPTCPDHICSDPIENLPTNFQEKHLGLIESHTLIFTLLLGKCVIWWDVPDEFIHPFICSSIPTSMLLHPFFYPLIYSLSVNICCYITTINSMRKGICLYCSLFCLHLIQC